MKFLMELVTLTEEIFNGKLHFLSNDKISVSYNNSKRLIALLILT